MEIIVGTYDEVILGFRIVKIGKAFQLEASFTDRSHAGCVKCIAATPKGFLASGGTDETVRLLHLKKQRELGSLVHHNGSVTSLEFYKGFLFSASEDKQMCLWKTFSWECLRTFKGHKGGITSLSVHPSGKLALTVGKDKALHTWNLMTGKSAYITNIKQVADLVKWSPSGERYVIVTNNQVDVYSVETAEVEVAIQAEGRINCIDFLNDDVLVYGGEGGKVWFYSIHDNATRHTCDTGTIRIKGLSLCTSPDDEEKKVLTIGSSEGYIKIYTIQEEKDTISTHILAEHNSAFRITCLTVYSPQTVETKNTDETDSPIVTQKSRKLEKRRKKPDEEEDIGDSGSDSEVSEPAEDEVPSKKQKVQTKKHKKIKESNKDSTKTGKKTLTKKKAKTE